MRLVAPDERPEPLTVVVAFEDMPDEHAIRHLEGRHQHQTAGLMIKPEPDRSDRRFRGGKGPWDIYHARMHVDPDAVHDHIHEEPK